jgi:hypothetical protein
MGIRQVFTPGIIYIGFAQEKNLMLEEGMNQGLFSLVEMNHLRMEAMRLFEQCLTNGDDALLMTFIERQIVQEPPRLQLLRDLADDLHQRLLSLREYHFDVRERVVRALSDGYHIDITDIAPPSSLDRYHLLNLDDILDRVNHQAIMLNEQDTLLIRKMVDASLKMAGQLYNDIVLTTRLHKTVLDWLEGMNAVIGRQYWTNDRSQSKNIHH